MSFTHAWGGFGQGAFFGAVAGLLGGIAIALFEGQSLGLASVFAAAFTLFGLLMGAFAGALVGSMNPDPSLEWLEHKGGVVVLVESHSHRDIEWAKRLMERHGGVLLTPPEPSGIPLGSHPSGA